MQRLELDQPLKIGARGSPLSLAQTGQLRARLAQTLGISNQDIDAMLPITAIKTTGDQIQDRPLSEAGGKGLFTKELDEALLDGRIDCAIHSLKDVPTQLPDGIILLSGPTREDRRDALITVDGLTLDQLPMGTIIGSASLRRGAQLRFTRPDLHIVSLRGNVGTRLEKLKAGEVQATLLAAAGLARLGLLSGSHRIPHVMLDPVAMPPAIGQGALAITVRVGDKSVQSAFARIADKDGAIETAAERAFLTALDGSCRTAIGAYAKLDDAGDLEFIGEALSADGQQRWRERVVLANANEMLASQMGRSVGETIKQAAGQALASIGP